MNEEIEYMIMKRKRINLMNTKWKILTHAIVSLVVVVMLGSGFGAAQQEDAPAKSVETVEKNITVQSRIAMKKGESGFTKVWYLTSKGERILIDASMNQVITAEINGMSIPRERIHFEDGRVTLTDEDGNEQTLHLLSKGLTSKVLINITATSNPLDHFVSSGIWTSRLPADVLAGMGNFQLPKSMIGIHTKPTSPELEHHLNIEVGTTVMVAGLYEGFSAHLAGIQRYDILLAFGGESPVSGPMIIKALRDNEPGSEIELTVIQAGETKDFTITLEAFEPERKRYATLIGENPRRRFRGSFQPAFEGMMNLHDIVVSPDNGVFMFLQQGMSPLMNEDIRVLMKKLEKFEGRPGMEGMPKFEVFINKDDEKMMVSPPNPE